MFAQDPILDAYRSLHPTPLPAFWKAVLGHCPILVLFFSLRQVLGWELDAEGEDQQGCPREL